MNQNIFKDAKDMIDARDVVSSILGEPAKISGENWYWHSPFNNGDNDPSFCVKADMISDFSTGEKGQDIFNFIENYNNSIMPIVSDKIINSYESLKWVVKEFNIDIDLSQYNMIVPDVKKIGQSLERTVKRQSLTISEGKHIKDHFIYAMFDTEGYHQKPAEPEFRKIKNRIPNLQPKGYTLQMLEDELVIGHTCIPAGIKSQQDWKDGENFYQVFMVDIDNVATVNGVKQKYTINDEKHVTVDKILAHCNSINLPPTFIYYTFSHTEQQHKFRLVFVLDLPISSKETVKGVYDFLKETFKDYNMDTAPTSIANMFLGGQSIAFESGIYYDIIEKTEIVKQPQVLTIAETCNKHLYKTPYQVIDGKLCYIKIIKSKNSKKKNQDKGDDVAVNTNETNVDSTNTDIEVSSDTQISGASNTDSDIEVSSDTSESVIDNTNTDVEVSSNTQISDTSNTDSDSDLIAIPISNFIAYPSSKINIINGKDVQTKYIMQCHILDNENLTLPEIIIDVDAYSKCNFIVGSPWDKYAIMSAGRGNTDRQREVMQIFARDYMDEKNLYVHTGFRTIDDKLCYLYHGGVIGDAENVDVDLSNDNLERFCFTNKEFDEKQALGRSLSFLEVADYKITIPISSTIYLSPLTTILSNHHIHADFILYIQGKSGSRKSSLTAVALSHFGTFDRNTFPCNFRDTLNTIEKRAFTLKDTTNVVDDYNPEVFGSKKLDTMEKLYAMYGDRIGRSRMSQDGITLKSGYTARGLCIATGEMIPEVAQSRIARSLIVTVQQNSIDNEKLSELQDNQEELAFCMKKYIEWLIQNIDRIIEYSKTSFKKLRKAQSTSNHGRTNEISAVINIGFRLFTQFLLEHNVIDNDRKLYLDGQAENVFKELVEEQTQEITELKPTEIFYSILDELIATNKVSYIDLATGQSSRSDYTIPEFVGYYDSRKQRYYLYPNTIYKAVSEHYHKSTNKGFPVNEKTLWRYLAEEGYLRQNDKKRYKVAMQFHNKKDYFIDVKAKHIDSSEVTNTFYRTPRYTPFRDVYDERPIDGPIKYTF